MGVVINLLVFEAPLDAAVAAELPPLKLDGASFQTVISQLDQSQWGPNGTSAVRFEASTNKGMVPGPIDKIASGGELARFLLAIKVVLESSNDPRSLIFDEVDSGVGGAVAAVAVVVLSILVVYVVVVDVVVVLVVLVVVVVL